MSQAGVLVTPLNMKRIREITGACNGHLKEGQITPIHAETNKNPC